MIEVESSHHLKVNIEIEEVLRFLGYRGGKKPEAKVEEVLGREIEEAYQLVRPRTTYCEIKALETKKESIKLEGDLLLHIGEKAVRWWDGCQSVVIALCTIGGMLEEKVSALFKAGKYTEALILDSAGSVAVDSLADQINRLICQKALISGVKVGPRLSAGYGKWTLEDQRLIFRLLRGESIGVHLTDQCMMIPQKSISFGVGVGVREDSRKINPCRYCGVSNCPYRRTN